MKRIFSGVMGIFFVTCSWMCGITPGDCGETGPQPFIHVPCVAQTFPPVYEGEPLSHSFMVLNKGSADLKIKRITHS
jgi:hypothetical protein